jgi:hypothetical protein
MEMPMPELAYVVDTLSLDWHGSEIRALVLSDGRDVRVLKDLCDALMVDDEAQRKRILAEPRWQPRCLYLEVPSAGGTQKTFLIERRIVKGLLYGVNPRAPRPDIAPDLDALKDEMDGVLDAAEFSSRCPQLATILGSVQQRQSDLFTRISAPDDVSPRLIAELNILGRKHDGNTHQLQCLRRDVDVILRALRIAGWA